MTQAYSRVGLTMLSVAALTLTGCVAPAQRYPSLLLRPIEAQSAMTALQVDPLTITVPADPALDAQIATLAGTLSTSADAFGAATARSTNAVRAAKDAAVGSEAWLSAQSALAMLESLRSQSLSALSDLDRLAIDRATASQPVYPGLSTARDRAEAQLTSQQALIDSLQGQIASF